MGAPHDAHGAAPRLFAAHHAQRHITTLQPKPATKGKQGRTRWERARERERERERESEREREGEGEGERER